ncbi:MAG: glycosyltransferase, partial [Actinomycetota bacterium]|nr:glycosyltransferase [Actinomycetota bacterium]
LVASRVGGIPDQVDHGEHGLLLDDPTDLDALAGALDRLLSDLDEADRLGRAARERVTTQFLGDRHLTQWLSVIDRLLEEYATNDRSPP